MKQPFLLLLVCLVPGIFACNKTNHKLSSSEAISGTYTAQTYVGIDGNMQYPINGQTLTMQVTPVSADSVQVHISSTPNGFFSPGASSDYNKLYVTPKICTNCQSSTYTIALAPVIDPNSSENTIVFDKYSKAYYVYTPASYTKGEVETIFIRTN
jgi:hypothetical protein